METNDQNLISRRDAIKKAALVFGSVLSTPAALTILQGCSPSRTSLDGFTDEERATVEAIANIIIPETDTAGATEAGAVQLLEDILFDVQVEEVRNDFLDKLADFENNARRELDSSFTEASADQQTAYINKIHDEAFAGEVDWDAPKPFIWQMKESIIYTYFGTEVGMTQVLQYIQVPGRFDPCIPFAEAGEGRVWASNIFG